MTAEAQKTDTKVLSVRLPIDEAERIDRLAADACLSRNDYLRMRLKEGGGSRDIGRMSDTITALRQLEQVYDRYLDVLEGLLAACLEERQTDDLRQMIEDEIKRASELVSLSYKAQQQAVKILKRFRRSVT